MDDKRDDKMMIDENVVMICNIICDKKENKGSLDSVVVCFL